MSRNCDLTASEQSVITSGLAKGKSTLEISKMIERYHQTAKRFIAAPMKVRKRTDKGHSRVVSQCSLLQSKCEAVNNPGLSSEELFRCIGKIFVSRTTRCCLLKKVGKSLKPVTMPPLTKGHIQKNLKWAKDSMKVDYAMVLVTYESRATTDGPGAKVES